MKKKIIVKRENNKGLTILKVLSTLLDYGADLKFQDIQKYLDMYEKEDEIIVYGDADCIDKSSKDFDIQGINYSVD